MTVPVTATPAERVRAACGRWGEPAVVGRCAGLLAGTDDGDPELLLYLGGRSAREFQDRHLQFVYWPRVWAARALLYAWSDSAVAAVVQALGDEAWRVREMAAKVAALREVGAAAAALLDLFGDEFARVRAAAARAAGVVGEAEHADGLRDLIDDEDPAVRRQAERSLSRLSARLDRDL